MNSKRFPTQYALAEDVLLIIRKHKTQMYWFLRNIHFASRSLVYPSFLIWTLMLMGLYIYTLSYTPCVLHGGWNSNNVAIKWIMSLMLGGGMHNLTIITLPTLLLVWNTHTAHGMHPWFCISFTQNKSGSTVWHPGFYSHSGAHVFTSPLLGGIWVAWSAWNSVCWDISPVMSNDHNN